MPNSPLPRTAQRVVQWSVGQGDAALIQWTRVRAGVVDTGPPGGLLFSQVLDAWAPGTPAHLEFLALTHNDLDHRGGVHWLARWVEWSCVIHPALFPGTSSPCAAPGIWQAIQPRSARAARRGNQSMLGAWIPLPSTSYLNLGDADRAGELRLWAGIKREIPLLFPGFKPDRRILKISHHGSKTGTEEQLLTEYAPTEAWISAGRRNSYGHPHPQTLLKLRLAGIQTSNTQEKAFLQ